MTANVFEESTLTLSAWVARGKGDRAKAKFEFEQEGGAQTVEAAELELGGKDGGEKKVSTTVTLPKCKDDEDFYTLRYKVTCGGASYPGGDFKVWLKTATFKAVDGEGSPLQGVPITYNQTGDKIYVTDSSGEVPLPINGTGPSRVTVRSPCSVDEWTTEVGRIREAKVTKKEYKVVVVDPTLEGNAEGTPLKQYVNLPADEGAPRQGSKLRVTVGGLTDSESIPGVPGDPVYVKLEFDLAKASKRNDPKRALIIDGSTVEPNDEGVAEGEMKFDDKGEAAFEVELGQAGGDAVAVHTGITAAAEDSTLHIQNWRKIWYQLTIPEGETEPDMSHSVTALEEVFIEYLQEGETVTIAKGTGPEGKLSWFDAEWIGGTAGEQVINIGNHNRDFFHALLDNKHSPLQTHVLCCTTQYDPAGANTEKQYLGLEVTAATKAPWSDGSEVVGVKQVVGRGFFPKKLLDGTSSIISGSWKASDDSISGDITDDDVHIADWAFTVKLPDEAAAYLAEDASNTVKVNMKVFKAKGPYNGESAKHKQLLRIGRADEEVNKTLCHELGHSLRQVPQSAAGKPPGLSAVTHGRAYTGNGHQGGHCADGMSDENYNGGAGKAGGDYAGNFKGKAECTCLMYGEGSSTRGNKYCGRCKPFIIAEAVSSVEA